MIPRKLLILWLFLSYLYFSICRDFSITEIPSSSANWEELVSSSNTIFSGRNTHATCVFKGRLWLTGGRTEAYTAYNLLSTTTAGDVWYSIHGDTWVQITALKGDFYAQNADVLQPGPIAPWYQRYGHSLDAIDVNGDSDDDYMMLAGGFSPDPSNDIWLTSDGVTWVYCGLAPWSPRAWHSTAKFQGQLWLMGGSPLNNEVWLLESIDYIPRAKPLTRAMYVNYTYNVAWKQFPNAAWSPRVGSGALSHWYFNHTAGKTVADSIERLVVIGGYGGWTESSKLYDGYHCRSDVWFTVNGMNWTVLTSKAAFGERAWFGSAVLSAPDPRLDISYPRNQSAFMFVVGGGNIGFSTMNLKRIVTMDGKLDCYRSRDGITWVKTNFEEGGGSTGTAMFSSQEWTRTTVNSIVVYLGMWGMSLDAFNSVDGSLAPDSLVLIAGSKTGLGGATNAVYRNSGGLFCDTNGVACNGNGECDVSTGSCSCAAGYFGTYCEETTTRVNSANAISYVTFTSCIVVALFTATSLLF